MLPLLSPMLSLSSSLSPPIVTQLSEGHKRFCLNQSWTEEGLGGKHFVQLSWLELQAFWALHRIPPLKIKLQSPLANVQIRGAVKHRCRQLSLLVSGGVEGMEKGGVGVFTPF